MIDRVLASCASAAVKCGGTVEGHTIRGDFLHVSIRVPATKGGWRTKRFRFGLAALVGDSRDN